MSLSTPVALLIFNRPDLTEIVFKAVAQAKPKKLLVVADGPRFPKEIEKCQKARSIIDRVDWNCEVLTNFSEKNLGSPRRCASGLNWIFSEVEEAIVLEDDCLPAPSFFNFCQTLLEHFRHDERVMHISGNNFQFGQSRTKYSYYFSKYSHNWGWASWQRAWKHFDLHIKTWPEFKEAELIKSVCGDHIEQKYWTTLFDRVFNAESLHWDYAWLYTCWSQYGLSILPNTNLVSNIGFRSDATHTISENSPHARLPISDIWEIKHPSFIIRNQEADSYTFNHIFRVKLAARVIRKLLLIKEKLKYKYRVGFYT